MWHRHLMEVADLQLCRKKNGIFLSASSVARRIAYSIKHQGCQACGLINSVCSCRRQHTGGRVLHLRAETHRYREGGRRQAGNGELIPGGLQHGGIRNLQPDRCRIITKSVPVLSLVNCSINRIIRHSAGRLLRGVRQQPDPAPVGHTHLAGGGLQLGRGGLHPPRQRRQARNSTPSQIPQS